MVSSNRPPTTDKYDLASFIFLFASEFSSVKRRNSTILYPLGESGGSISRDEYISQVAQDIQNKLPELFDLDRIRKHFSGNISPTSVVLLQELERFNKLVVRMQRSLVELQRVRSRGTRQKAIEKTQ